MTYKELTKVARGGGIGNDQTGAAAWGAGTLGLSSLIGRLHGIVKGPATTEELDEMDEHPGRSWAPGVGDSRQVRKTLATARASKNPRTLVAGELFGPLTSSAPVMAAATLIGAAMASPQQRGAGAAKGAMVGAGIVSAAHMLAAILAKIKKRRTPTEQAMNDSEAGIGRKNWLIPGVGLYNRLKRKDIINTEEDTRNNYAEWRTRLKALMPGE